MDATTTPFGPEFVKELIPWFLKMIDDSTRQAYRMIWSYLIQYLKEHWGFVIIALVSILVLALIEYLITGRWKTLGRVLYSYFYWGIVFVITLIFGPEVFANDWFKIVLVLVYGVSFYAVGKLLVKTGIRR